MHQSSTSKPMSLYPSHRPTAPVSLTRYGSAPGSLLTSIADSVVGEFSAVGSDNLMSRFFSGENSPCLTSESSCKTTVSPIDLEAAASYKNNTAGGRGEVGLQRTYSDLNEIAVGDLSMDGANLKGGSPLIRHSSSPAGFFSHLMIDNGFSVTKAGSYSQSGTEGVQAMANRRLKSQLSFSRQDSLSQISEISIPDVGERIAGSNSSDDAAWNVGQSYIASNFPLGSWDDTNSIVFSAPPSKRAKDNNGDTITGLGNIDSQFGLPKTSLEMASVEKYLQMQQDSVPCKIRAKRGCATHPRSIAERERRTRISEKLRKLQELVPNMDKQTNTADMLDLAVHHIKGLQSQVQKLNQERANCTCTSRQDPL